MLRREAGRSPFRLRAVCALAPPEGVGFLGFAKILLDAAGLGHPEELRGLFVLPSRRLLRRRVPSQQVVAPTDDPLFQAAVLGLCNNGLYSPDHPMIWTEKRLARRIELYSVEGFYAH